jgi:uncharacterized protein (TIGR00290 family)
MASTMKAFMSWSGGKDSALALVKGLEQNIPVSALVTSVARATNRVSMHGVRTELLQRQAASLGLPLQTIELPDMPGMQVYEQTVRETHRVLKADGFTHGVFGDIFLEDLKAYRETLLAQDGLQCYFPLWQRDSGVLLEEFLAAGFKAIVVCVDGTRLDKSFCGRLLDHSFFNDLPPTVDPCGENGEFHSFVFDGPGFAAPVPFRKGGMVVKEYAAPSGSDDCFAEPGAVTPYYFCDLLPA